MTMYRVLLAGTIIHIDTYAHTHHTHAHITILHVCISIWC